MRIGVLALQGDVREHLDVLAQLGAEGRVVRTRPDLDDIDGIILPGGESTTLSLLLVSSGLFEPLGARIGAGMPVLGTCAGLVLLATEVRGGRADQRGFDALDCAVRRNGFGRQVESFEGRVELVDALRQGGESQMPAVFIRAPLVEEVGQGVDVLAWLRRHEERLPVVLKQDSVLASAFHPELTQDHRLHRLFLAMAQGKAATGGEGSNVAAKLAG